MRRDESPRSPRTRQPFSCTQRPVRGDVGSHRYGRCVTHRQKPQYLTSAMLEERNGAVTLTLGLGDEIPGEVDFFGYGIDYYGPDGNGGKRFGVRFGAGEASTLVFEWSSATQGNAGSIFYLEDGLMIVYPDASIGMDEIGSIHAFTHVNGDDVQTNQHVTVLR